MASISSIASKNDKSQFSVGDYAVFRQFKYSIEGLKLF